MRENDVNFCVMHTNDIKVVSQYKMPSILFFQSRSSQGVNMGDTIKHPNCLYSFLSLGPNEREASRKQS